MEAKLDFLVSFGPVFGRNVNRVLRRWELFGTARLAVRPEPLISGLTRQLRALQKQYGEAGWPAHDTALGGLDEEA